jgi:hypothetical protein
LGWASQDVVELKVAPGFIQPIFAAEKTAPGVFAVAIDQIKRTQYFLHIKLAGEYIEAVFTNGTSGTHIFGSERVNESEQSIANLLIGKIDFIVSKGTFYCGMVYLRIISQNRDIGVERLGMLVQVLIHTTEQGIEFVFGNEWLPGAA